MLIDVKNVQLSGEVVGVVVGGVVELAVQLSR
jgi:hypothetical protein